MVIAVFKIDQEGAVLKVDEVKFINKLIFTDRFSVFQPLVFSDSAGNLVDVVFFGYTDLGVGIGLHCGSDLMGIAGFNQWVDEFHLFFGAFHFLHPAHLRNIASETSSGPDCDASSVTKYIPPQGWPLVYLFWCFCVVYIG
jgi:hypothetical protein